MYEKRISGRVEKINEIITTFMVFRDVWSRRRRNVV
jgi:hypothetical protein